MNLCSQRFNLNVQQDISLLVGFSMSLDKIEKPVEVMVLELKLQWLDSQIERIHLHAHENYSTWQMSLVVKQIEALKTLLLVL